ncbi:TPA: hypothetical protein ACH3X2_012973 [Trebouxia sp. C0005]
MSDQEEPTEVQEIPLKIHELLLRLGLVLRPTGIQPGLSVSVEPLKFPFDCGHILSDAQKSSTCTELSEDAKILATLGPQPTPMERALQKCASLVQVTTQRSTYESARYQAGQAALCRVALTERANLEQMQSALQSTVICYKVAVRKGAHLQQLLDRLQPRFVGLRREKDRAEQRAADLATQNLHQSERVQELEGHQGRLSGQVLLLERQNTTLGNKSASLQDMLDATSLKLQEEAAARQHFQMDNEVLQYEVADLKQEMVAQGQKLKAQEQHMHEQGEQLKGQEQQVAHQVDGLHSKLREAQHSKEAAVKVQYVQHDLISRLQGQVQVLEEEKAEGQKKFAIVQAEGLTLSCQVTDLTGQKAELVEHNKEVQARATGLEVQVTDLTQEVDHFKQRARVACEEQSQQKKGHLAEVKQLKDLITKQERKAVTSETLVDKLQRQLAESSTRVSSLTSTLEAAQKSHKNTVQGHSAELQKMQGLVANKDKESSARQERLDSLQKQLADISSHVSSLTMELEIARQTLKIAGQGHSAELQKMQGLIAQQGKECIAKQERLDSLQKQLAESFTRVSSLTSNLEAAQKSHNDTVQGHNAELQRLQGLLAQQDKEASARQERIASPALEQLADTSSWGPSLTMDGLKDLLDGLKDSGKSSSPSQAAPSTLAQQGQPNKGTWAIDATLSGPASKDDTTTVSDLGGVDEQPPPPTSATQVALEVPSQLHGRGLLDGLKDRGSSSSPSQAAPSTLAQGAGAFAVMDGFLFGHASKGATRIVSGLGGVDEQPPPMTSATQVGALSKDMMLRKPPGITTLADSGLQGGSISPTTADPAGIRAAGYSPQSDATSTMPLGHASEATSASHLPQGMPQLQEVQQTVITPQGVHRTSLGAFPETCQNSICKNFAALRHGGRLVLDDLIQLDTRDQMLTACAMVGCSKYAARKFADALCKAKRKTSEIAAREAAKGARPPAAASAAADTSAPHAAQGPFPANGHASDIAPSLPLTACAPPGVGNMGDNGGLSGHDNGRRFGDGDDAATKQLPKLLIAAEESPGLPVALPPQSSAPGKPSWAAVASASATAQTGPVRRRRQPHTAGQRGTPLQGRQQPNAQQLVGQDRASAPGVGLFNNAGSNDCCVNVVVQVLRHCPALQKWLRNVALPDDYQGHEAVKELVRLFNRMDELATAPESMRAADPRGFREALAALKGSFPQDQMLDASEILALMYEALDNLACSLSRPQLFRSDYQACVDCPKCRKKTFVLEQSEYILEATATLLALRKPPVRMGQHLFQTEATRQSCNTDEGGCGDVQVVKRSLLNPQPPAVFTIQMRCPSIQATPDAIQKTLDGIDMVLRLDDLYPHLERNIPYQLQEVVCSLVNHYVSYCRQPCGRWVKQDDVIVRSLPGWKDVCIDCTKGHCQPTILMYGMIGQQRM